MKPIIAIVNNKGGVGKTFITLNLASVFSEDFNTLIIDTDPQNNIATTLYDHIIDEIEKKKNLANIYEGEDAEIIKIFPDEFGKGENKKLYLIPGHRKKMQQLGQTLKNQNYKLLNNNKFLNETIEKFDIIFIDCPPDLNIFTYNALYLSNYLIIPVIPGKNELIGIENLFNAIDEISKDIGHKINILGALINRYKLNRNLSAEFFELMEKYFGEEKIFSEVITESDVYGNAIFNNYPIDLFLNKSDSKVQTFYNLKEEVIKKIKLKKEK